MGGFTFPQKEHAMSNTDDPQTDRENARTALADALEAARSDDAQKADAFTRIADAHIRMSTINRS